MKAVSCRAFGPFALGLRRARLPLDTLLEGVEVPLESLLDKHERMSWADWRQMAINGRKLWPTPNDFIELGREYVASPFARPLRVVVRLLFSGSDIARIITGPIRASGDSMFHNVRTSFLEVSETRIRVELVLSEDSEPCPEFFYVTQGYFINVMALLGGRRGDLQLDLSDRRGLYTLTFPKRRGILSILWNWLRWPFTARSAARELEEAHEVLQSRYAELEAAREILDQQAAQLRTAHAISELIHQNLDLQRTLPAVAEALRTELGAAAAEVAIDCVVEGQPITDRARTGEPGAHPAVTRTIAGRSGEIGILRLWTHGDVICDVLESTLDFVLPSVTMTVENALAYDSVVRYRDQLEERVEERTRDLRETRDDLAHSLEELERAQAVRERIFANINHELRTPLALISLASAEARTAAGAGDTDVVVARLAGIDRSVTRLLGLVDGLLLLAARDEGKLTLKIQRIDLAERLRGTVESWAPLARRHDLVLTYDGPKRYPAHVDPLALDRVVGNLLSNAIKFTPDGGRITTALTDDGDRVRIDVTDTGVGIDEVFATRAFERFEQGPTPVRSESNRGSGIGLSIVREIAAAHGGEAWATPRPPRGTCMTITLPRFGAVTADEDPALPAPPDASGQSATVSPPDSGASSEGDAAGVDPAAGPARATILVAEDEPELRGYIQRVLGKEYRVLSASDGEAALELAEEHRPDLLITDLQMPRMDGLELTRRFSELEENRIAPVLILTASAGLESRLAGFDSGAVDYILKPFHPGEILARVRAQLAIRDLALRLHETEKLASIGLLGASLAHDIRNPVNAIANALAPLRRLLPEEALAPGSAASALWSAVAQSAERLQTFCDAILALENPGLIRIEAVGVHELIRGATTGLSALENMSLLVDVPEGLQLHCSRHIVIEVLANLLENAAHATDGKGTIHIEATEEGATTVVRITDDGPGIPVDQRERIFEAFFTTKDPGVGTGLGLAMARKAIHHLGGTLRALDAPTGATFEIRLPSGPEPSAADLEHRRRQEAQS